MSFYRTGLFTVLCFYLLSPNVFAHHPGYATTGASNESAGRKSSISSEAMINSPTASTLGRNHFSAGFVFAYSRYRKLPAEYAHRLHHQGHDIHGKNHEEFYAMEAGYGILDDLDLYLTVPIVSKSTLQVHDHKSLGKGERSTGFGDMRLGAQFRFWKKYVELAVLAGVKFPTGKTNDKDKTGVKFEAEQQPGSGSWDGDFGIVASRSFFERLSLASSFQYTLKGYGAQNHKSGDVFRYNIGAAYSLRRFGRYPNLSLIYELNHEWALRDHSREQKRVLDSGGTAVFGTPGVRAQLTKNISAFWGMSLPIYQNLGGEHEKLRYEIISGINIYV